MGRRPGALKPRATARRAPQPAHVAVLALLGGIPLVFSSATAEAFEFPKTLLLVSAFSGALAWGVVRAWARATREGPGAWLRGLPARAAAWARSDPVGASIALFLFSAAASTVVSQDRHAAIFGAYESRAGLPVALATAWVYYTSRAAARDERWLTRLAGAACFASAIASGYALLQVAGLDPVPWHQVATYGGALRAFGTVGHANILGGYLATALPLVVWLVAGTRTRPLRLVAGLVAASSTAAIIATLSRGAWLALAVAGIAAAVLSVRALRRGADEPAGPVTPPVRPRRAFLSAAALLLAAGLILVPLLSSLGPNLATRVRELGSLAAPTTRSRIEIWRAALRMAEDRPVLGVGVEAFGAVFPRYRPLEYWRIEWGATPVKAHNEGIHILATQGVFGALAATLVVLLVAGAAWRAAGSARRADRWGAVAVAGALGAFATQSLTSFTMAATGTLAAALAGWFTGVASGAKAEGADASPGARAVTGPRAPLRVPAAAWVAGAVVCVSAVNALVLIPWRAERAAFDALVQPDGTPGRATGLARAAAIDPGSSRHFSALGSTLLLGALREPDGATRIALLGRAREALGRAVALAPVSPVERAFLARTYATELESRQDPALLDRAQRGFAEALRIDPTNGLVLIQAEESWLRLGRFPDARAAALRLTSLYPALGKPLADIGYMALVEERYQAAADTLELAAGRSFPHDMFGLSDALTNLSAAYLGLERPADALAAADRALAARPDHRGAMQNRARALLRMGG